MFDKSKVMVMSKSGRRFNYDFNIGNVNIETVQSFTYLGVKFSASGSFTLAQKELSQKANKACYKLKKAWNPACMTPKLGIKLFDQLVAPVLSYGSEIWSVPSNFKESKFIKSLEKAEGEKFHTSYCKAI